MRNTRVLVATGLLVTGLLSGACFGQPETPTAVTSSQADIEVISINEHATKTSQITMEKEIDQCDVPSEYEQTISRQMITNERTQDELILGFGPEVEISLGPAVKATLAGEIQRHYTTEKSQEDGMAESGKVTVPPYTRQVLVLVWNELRREGDITYLENGEHKSLPFSFRTGFELVSSKGIPLECPNQTPTEAPTATPYPTYTPVATATPYPTYTPPPAQVRATNTPRPVIPTNTPTSTNTPVANTPPGTILTPGQTWIQDGLTLRVQDFRLEEGYCGVSGLWNDNTWSAWKVVLTNKSGKDLFINLDPSAWFFSDSTGRFYQMNNKGGFALIKLGGRIVNCAAYHEEEIPSVQLLKNGETVTFDAHGFGTVGDADWYEFGVYEAGRITDARWRFDIPR